MTESAKTRYTAVAKYFEGKTLHQIAADLGLSWCTIRDWLCAPPGTGVNWIDMYYFAIISRTYMYLGG